jgi:LAO/AO transport system kinase
MLPSADPAALLGAARAGDHRSLGRLLSMVERGGPAARAVGRLAVAPAGDVELVVGITGAPGAGKSTLVDGLVGQIRVSSRRVGVLAVDPSSPFSGGAILGDRVRMGRHAGDGGVFVRSMAARGHLGGLALAAPEAVRVLAAAGMDVVVVETVGVGQAEIEVAGAADTTVVVVNPGWGDDVQANKAGLLEIADVFVVNKADRPGAEAARRDLEAMLDLGAGGSPWRPPVLLAVAASGDGVADLWAAVQAHRAHLVATGQLAARRQERLVDEMGQIMARHLVADARQAAGQAAGLAVTGRLRDRVIDPYDAAEELLAAVVRPRARPK